MVDSTLSTFKTKATGPDGERRAETVIERSIIDMLLARWPEVPQRAAKDILAKCGDPNEATDSCIICFNRGAWKRITVYRDEVPHNYPKPHVDVLERAIAYKDLVAAGSKAGGEGSIQRVSSTTRPSVAT